MFGYSSHSILKQLNDIEAQEAFYLCRRGPKCYCMEAYNNRSTDHFKTVSVLETPR